jgi:DNA polymerase III sliding clamp (beta) subunit (PCNA family)
VRAIVPNALADAMRALLGGRAQEQPQEQAQAQAELRFDGGRITLSVDGSQAAGQCLDFDFPDYRRLSRLPAGRRLPVRASALREALLAGPAVPRRRGQDEAEYDLSLLSVAQDGDIAVIAEADAGTAGTGGSATVVGVNRGFLLDALRIGAGEADELVLELGDPAAPLAIRPPEPEASGFTLLMPVRLEG